MAELVLEPEQGVSISSGEFVADSLPAWLSIPNFLEVCGRSWFSIRYASSFFDRPVRPLLRFRTQLGRDITYILNGPVLGTAEWIGRVPDNSVSVSICTTDRLGPFAFRIEKAGAVSKYSLAGRNIAAAVSRSGRLATSRRSDAWQFEIDLYKIANRATPLANYTQWAHRFRRAPELYGLDRPRSDWTNGPVFSILMPIGPATRPELLQTTINSLLQQFYHRWSLTVCIENGVSDHMLRAYRESAAHDGRLREIDLPLISHADSDADWLAVMSPGDTLDNLALGAITEEMSRRPMARLIYSDEDAMSAQGKIHSPLLKPDWSPVFQDGSNYIGRLACIRKDALGAAGVSDPRALTTRENDSLRDVLACLSGPEVAHVRRILYRRQAPASSQKRPSNVIPSRSETTALPDATIVMVTKDRADLLSRSLFGIQHQTDYPDFNVVIVDNGTTEKDALALLASLKSDNRFLILQRPGPFNFSALCNEGARLSHSQLLVFLNNDVEMGDRNWLKRLAEVAVRPNVGVAGATLLYPSGRIQHAGVTLGLGTVAGHLYSGAPANHADYLGHLTADREVSAVTAACCAIERVKFEKLGGFDDINLPVEFNDIDLCLRAMEQGWSNICVSKSVLIHLESETRGVAQSKVYELERNYFVQRWSHIIRDDPYFHPGLSMFALQPCLA
jgi:GT2 family glycosyltransferase